MSGEGACFLEVIGKTLSGRTPGCTARGSRPCRDAAVLIPLFVDEGECRVLFTKRTETVVHHKGQISFPGGAVDEEDRSFEETALREAREEIGLNGEDVRVLGRLDDTLTVVSDFVIHSYVGLIPYPYDFVLNPVEVKSLVTMPLRIFHPRETAARGSTFEYNGEIFHGPTFTYGGETIWGATARIMDMFMTLLDRRIPLHRSEKQDIYTDRSGRGSAW